VVTVSALFALDYSGKHAQMLSKLGTTSGIPLQQRVIEIVAKSLGRSDSARVGASASLVRDLRADALDKIEIILALEDSFNIRISDLDAERIETVRDAVDCVFHASNRAGR
jgi:acyl carrier protein